jgi:PDZ domain-containing protein
MFSRLSRIRKVSVVFFIALMPLGLMKTDYYFMSPGPPYQWEIIVQDQISYDYEGNLYQLTVRRDISNYFVYAWAYLSESVDLYPKETILPKGVTPSELTQISLQNMQTSENVAIAVALNSLGYNVKSEGDGVLVVGLLDNSPVINKLQKNDLIVSLSGKDDLKNTVNSSTQFISLLRTFSIGETVSIGIVRDGKDMQIQTTLIEHIEYKGEPMVGFLASTPNQRFTFPIKVDIDTGNVGGPSAGLMMALNVYNKLTDIDITNSNVIAGTGTIEIDGSVGPVGGVKQKVIAAKRAGATLILVPTANYDEAKSFQDDKTTIIAIETFDNALEVISEYSSR